MLIVVMSAKTNVKRDGISMHELRMKILVSVRYKCKQTLIQSTYKSVLTKVIII